MQLVQTTHCSPHIYPLNLNGEPRMAKREAVLKWGSLHAHKNVGWWASSLSKGRGSGHIWPRLRYKPFVWTSEEPNLSCGTTTNTYTSSSTTKGKKIFFHTPSRFITWVRFFLFPCSLFICFSNQKAFRQRTKKTRWLLCFPWHCWSLQAVCMSKRKVRTTSDSLMHEWMNEITVQH